jgi:hypothetical protein
LKEISQLFEGNFGQNKEKKRIFWFFKVEALGGRVRVKTGKNPIF